MRPRLILASKSPRRRELLARWKIPFTAVESDYEEDMTLPLPPLKLAKVLSWGKATAVARKYRHGIVIAADTFIAYHNTLLGKPKSPADAKRMLRQLSGRTHSVITGLAIIDTATGRKVSKAIEAKITFRKLTDREINTYVTSGEPLDKAGAYAIQGIGSVIIKKIDGDYHGVMGLPLYQLAQELKKFGVKVL